MNPISFDLTLEQQFQMRLIVESANGMSQEQLTDTLIQASRLLMLKENVIQSMMKHSPIQSFS